MPVRKRPGRNCYKVENVTTNRCLTREEARRQERAINAERERRRRRSA